MTFDTYTYLVIPLLIFFARVIDVSMGTVRMIFTARGYKISSTVIGFFEVLIWLIAIRQILENLTSVFCYVGYAAGFATGTYIGMLIEEKLSIGKVIVRVITRKDAFELLNVLRSMRHIVTAVDAEGRDGRVHIIFTVISRAEIRKVTDAVREHNPHAFYTIEDVRSAGDVYHYGRTGHVTQKKRRFHPFRRIRKGK